MRIIIVSNRLPVSINRKNGKLHVNKSVGGLVTGVNSFLKNIANNDVNMKYIWLGCPGENISVEDEAEVKEKLKDSNCHPIFFNKAQYHSYYAGFCNGSLWPLFHYFSSYYSYRENWWQEYKNVNQKFAEALFDILQPEDVVWVHDYHLMLLPQLINQLFPATRIGFFLHIPFPCYELFQLLPIKCRLELLNSLLVSNLIGFHTEEYQQNFLNCCNKQLGHATNINSVIAGIKEVQVDVFPMGVDFHGIQNFANCKQFSSEKIRKILNGTNDLKIIISVDRLDYTKGIGNRLVAYEKFIETNPAWRHHVILLLIVAPSRENVGHYKKIKKEVNELVGKINGKYGNLNWIPILYQYKPYTLEYLIRLFSLSDVGLITPLRDGMNLVAKEYVSAHVNKNAVLVLSETTGAANELKDAILINADCSDEIANALKQALEMDPLEKAQRMKKMQETLEKNNVIQWGRNFMKILLGQGEANVNSFSQYLNSSLLTKIHANYSASTKRLLLLDYDGTLVPFVDNPMDAIPYPELLCLLDSLGRDTKNEIVILSGRDRNTLQKWFGDLNINLVSENGVWIKNGSGWVLAKQIAIDKSWKIEINNILQGFNRILPGSYVEVKECSLTWHYRNSVAENVNSIVSLLVENLLKSCSKYNLRIIKGNKIIEIINSGVGKDLAVLQFTDQKQYDFILAIGDDVTDEDMFRVLPENAYSIKVGGHDTCAKYTIQKPAEVINLLSSLNY